eukprot:COSAG02_NODE_5415_length_4348_cov_2.023770_4_plen_43_part_00
MSENEPGAVTLSYVRSWAESIIDSITLKLGALLVSDANHLRH